MHGQCTANARMPMSRNLPARRRQPPRVPKCTSVVIAGNLSTFQPFTAFQPFNLSQPWPHTCGARLGPGGDRDRPDRPDRHQDHREGGATAGPKEMIPISCLLHLPCHLFGCASLFSAVVLPCRHAAAIKIAGRHATHKHAIHRRQTEQAAAALSAAARLPPPPAASPPPSASTVRPLAYPNAGLPADQPASLEAKEASSHPMKRRKRAWAGGRTVGFGRLRGLVGDKHKKAVLLPVARGSFCCARRPFLA